MKKKNVLFLLLDGIRSDRISRCPYLTSVLKKGTYFPNMITSAPYTLGAVHSLLTGLYPYKHGVNGYHKMFAYRKNACKHIGQYLQDAGYYTGWNMVNKNLAPQEGFDSVSTHDEMHDDLFSAHSSILDSVKDKPFCLLLQYSKVHATYVNTYLKSEEDYFGNVEKNVAAYNSALDDLDSYLKKMFSYLKDTGLMEDTIVVVFSDHGTSNGEKKGEKFYGAFTYDSTIKIFCSIFMPGMQAKEIGAQVSLIDVLPTLLEELDIAPDAGFEEIQGKSLFPFISGTEDKDRVAFTETGGLTGPWPSPEKHNVFSMRMDGFKVVKTPDGWELYNLHKDPLELDNLASTEKKLLSMLQPLLQKHIDEMS
jgi:arylsulfatase A-like enzyme